MKLYHIDRSGHLSTNQILNLTKGFYNKVTDNEYYEDGLSSHGLYYYLEDADGRSFSIDAIFEYERLLHYPEKLSRYQAFYAFDINGVAAFAKKKELEDKFCKVYEVDVESYERHNMSLVRGWSNCVISKFAKLYWNDGIDPDEKREVIYEYLIRLPVKIGREVSVEELKEEYKKNNPPVDKDAENR